MKKPKDMGTQCNLVPLEDADGNALTTEEWEHLLRFISFTFLDTKEQVVRACHEELSKVRSGEKPLRDYYDDEED